MSAPAALVATYGLLLALGGLVLLVRDALAWLIEHVWWGAPGRPR